MLVDVIPAHRLPSIMVWLDWNIFAYKYSLFVCVLVAFAHRVSMDWYTGIAHQRAAMGMSPFAFGGQAIGTALVVGCCLWVVWCAVWHGYDVG